MMDSANKVSLALTIIALSVLVLFGCSSKGKPTAAGTGSQPEGTPTAALTDQTEGEVRPGISSDELSYRHTPLTAEEPTPGADFLGEDPGDNERIVRAFENAPPLIPHAVADLLPITLDNNACLDCHLPDVADDAGATALPASHFYDIRRDKELENLSGTNFYCTLCHAPQTDAAKLVDNTFQPEFRNEASKSSSNLLDTLNEGVE